MKTTLLVAALIVTSGTASAQSYELGCEHFEYAELKEMPKEYLFKKHCVQKRKAFTLFFDMIKQPTQSLQDQYKSLSFRCGDEMERSARMLEAQFQITNLECPE